MNGTSISQDFPRVALVAILTAGAIFPAWSADDHSHEPAAAAGHASPRMEAHSDLFELVGVVDKGQMTIYLDRYATNEPVLGARIEFESGPNKGAAIAQADGTYLIKFDALSQPGELPFAFTVSAGADTDLLAGELDLKAAHEDHADAGRPWLRWTAYGIAGVLSLALVVFLARKYNSARVAHLKA